MKLSVPNFQAVPKGTKLITEGDLNADYFYIVQSGRVWDSVGWLMQCRVPAFFAPAAAGGSFNVIVDGKDSVEAGHKLVDVQWVVGSLYFFCFQIPAKLG